MKWAKDINRQVMEGMAFKTMKNTQYHHLKIQITNYN